MALIQVVIQELETTGKRIIPQYGDGVIPTEQKQPLMYDELTDMEKGIYDTFMNMIMEKRPE